MKEKSSLLLRVALAFSFLYPPIAALFAPESWIGYFPQAARGVLPDPILLGVWGLLEVGIALWILSGWRIFLPSALAGILLVLIVAINLPQFEVVFRDLSLAILAFYLAYQAKSAPAVLR